MRWECLLVLLAACGNHGNADVDASCVPSVLYLNRSGGTYEHGTADNAGLNQSTIVDAPLMLAPFPHDDVEWADAVACIRDALQPFPIQVTENDPGLGPHVELVFTTSYWAGSPGQTHAIPGGCFSRQELGFVFGNAIPTDARTCQIALIAFAQMTAKLSYGENCRDWVDRSMDCVQDRAFIDEDVPCVDANNQPIACRCGGTTQNTFRALADAHRSCQ